MLALQVKLAQIAFSIIQISIALASTTPTTNTPPPLYEKWAGYGILRPVSSCETTWDVNAEPRMTADDGGPLWGWDAKLEKIIKRDVGPLQINTFVHLKRAKSLGFDIVNNPDDNIAFGKILYREKGLQPWIASRDCWSGKLDKLGKK